MLNQAAVFGLISQLGGSNNNIIYNAKFIDYCGGCHYSALLLAQLLYWSDKTRLEGGWIAKTKEEWNNELRLTPYKMRLAEVKLRDELGVLEISVKKWNGFPTNHYRFIQDAFVASFVKFFEDGYSKDLSKEDTKKFSATNLKSFEQPITDTTKQNLQTEPTNIDSGGPTARRGSQKKEAKPKKNKEDVCPVFKDALRSFEEEFKKRNGVPPKFNGGTDGAHLKSILTHLRKVAPDNDWETALNLFNAILLGWSSLPKWFADKFQLNIINSQLNAILTNISETVRGIGPNSKFTGEDWEE